MEEVAEGVHREEAEAALAEGEDLVEVMEEEVMAVEATVLLVAEGIEAVSELADVVMHLTRKHDRYLHTGVGQTCPVKVWPAVWIRTEHRICWKLRKSKFRWRAHLEGNAILLRARAALHCGGKFPSWWIELDCAVVAIPNRHDC